MLHVALLQVKAEKDEVAAKIGKSGESEDEDEGGAESGDVSSGLAALAAAMSGDGDKKKEDEERKKSEWKQHSDPDVEVMDNSASKDDLKKLSIKELREKCKEMGKDASKCTDKDDLIAVIQDPNAPKAKAAAAAPAPAPAPAAGGVHRSPSSQRAGIPHKFDAHNCDKKMAIVFFGGSSFCARTDGFKYIYMYVYHEVQTKPEKQQQISDEAPCLLQGWAWAAAWGPALT
jgi:hypothetical protein